MPERVMTPEMKRILTDALALSDDQRSVLADYLYASVVPIDPKVQEKVMEEVRERSRALDAGEAELIPAAEVFEELKNELRVLREPRKA